MVGTCHKDWQMWVAHGPWFVHAQHAYDTHVRLGHFSLPNRHRIFSSHVLNALHLQRLSAGSFFLEIATRGGGGIVISCSSRESLAAGFGCEQPHSLDIFLLRRFLILCHVLPLSFCFLLIDRFLGSTCTEHIVPETMAAFVPLSTRPPHAKTSIVRTCA